MREKKASTISTACNSPAHILIIVKHSLNEQSGEREGKECRFMLQLFFVKIIKINTIKIAAGWGKLCCCAVSCDPINYVITKHLETLADIKRQSHEAVNIFSYEQNDLL